MRMLLVLILITGCAVAKPKPKVIINPPYQVVEFPEGKVEIRVK